MKINLQLRQKKKLQQQHCTTFSICHRHHRARETGSCVHENQSNSRQQQPAERGRRQQQTTNNSQLITSIHTLSFKSKIRIGWECRTGANFNWIYIAVVNEWRKKSSAKKKTMTSEWVTDDIGGEEKWKLNFNSIKTFPARSLTSLNERLVSVDNSIWT